MAILEAACAPLAEILAVMLTHDPELDPIVFVGGVTSALGQELLTALVGQLNAIGMYQMTERDPDYFRRRLQLGFDDDDSGLLGCTMLDHAGGDHGP